MDISSTSTGGGGGAVPTFEKIDEMLAIFGTNKTAFWPFLNSTIGSGSFGIWTYGEELTKTWLVARDQSANRNLRDEFEPYMHVGGIHSYAITQGAQTYLSGQDESNLGFPSNENFSCGAWILPRDNTDVTIMGKWDNNNQREWRLILDGNKKISLQTYDESNNQSRVSAADTEMPLSAWQFVVATTDNNDSDLSHTAYLNAVADGSGNTASDASFANSPDTSSLFCIGATLNTAPAVSLVFEGRIALPFVCGKELSASEVSDLYTISKTLIGLA